MGLLLEEHQRDIQGRMQCKFIISRVIIFTVLTLLPLRHHHISYFVLHRFLKGALFEKLQTRQTVLMVHSTIVLGTSLAALLRQRNYKWYYSSFFHSSTSFTWWYLLVMLRSVKKFEKSLYFFYNRQLRQCLEQANSKFTHTRYRIWWFHTQTVAILFSAVKSRVRIKHSIMILPYHLV